MLNKRPMYVDVENYSETVGRIYDPQLSNGFIEIQPGERFGLPTTVFLRNLRSASRWMRRFEEAIPVPEEEPVLADEFGGMKMSELRALARERGFTVKVGMSKQDAIGLLKEAYAQ